MYLTKYSSHEKLAKIAKKNSSNLVVYINNIGISEWRKIERVENKFLNKNDTNLISYFWGCKVAKKYIKKDQLLIFLVLLESVDQKIILFT